LPVVAVEENNTTSMADGLSIVTFLTASLPSPRVHFSKFASAMPGAFSMQVSTISHHLAADCFISGLFISCTVSSDQ
jgi:hypothetical protein